ncbi:MAG: DNA mismatch repair endonuclease MutL [Candidatus Margulisbacteria bacterium]|nr:DNA mismatch repair endonuclease MutL [Candidatus Margulisiibacteriota bacterium]
MASRIKILPEDLTNKIAAGEVVERPASVVKELLENAIDAKATQIKVEIQSAGRKLIRVSDNGQGMTREEVRLAIERHSTSKISQLDDLFNIQTLGFRGEALPSIASVSIMEIRSKDKDEEAGSLLRVEGGKIGKIEEIGCPVGTTLIVKDLFFNTPARKKFLKSPPTEIGHIGDIVAKYALAKPQIAFELVSDGKPLLVTSGSGRLKDAVAAIYGVELAKELVEAQLDFKLGKISGLISRPTLSRLDKSYETFFVNGRYVKNFLLNRALEEGYRTLIPNNRYPIAILFIEIDPKQIDVNVHPTKREIKFVKTQEVMGAIRDCVRLTLEQKLNIKQPVAGDGQGSGSWTPSTDLAWKPEMADALFSAINDQLPVTSQEIEIDLSAVQPLFPIYQYKATYIICTDGEDLALIDQHAAHERIIYDQLGHKAKTQAQQPLLVPETIETSPKEAAVLGENIEYLKGLGFDLEEFGNNTYILRSVPAIATKNPAKQMLLDIVSELQTLGKSAQLEIKQENIRKLIACHSAIKAGDKLSVQEMNQLIKDLFATENPATCPHGRPTMIRLSQEELDNRFGR